MKLKKIFIASVLGTLLMSPSVVGAEILGEPISKYVTAVSGLNYRTGDSIEFEKIGALPYGNKVTVKEITENDWACVEIDGQEYYMSNQWLSEEKPEIERTKQNIQVSNSASTNNVETSSGSYYGKCRITHYCNCSKCCGSYAGGPTASGSYPVIGRTVAMSGLPFGTKVSINGHVYIVEDRGVSGNAVDIYVGSHSEALNRGMYYADVYIIG